MLVTDLTRMQRGYLCVAGIDEETGARIRPVLDGGQRFSIDTGSHRGGPLDFRAVIDLGAVRPVGTKPEVEDVLISPERVRRVGTLSGAEFFERLSGTVVASVSDAIGPDLVVHSNGHNYICALGRGNCSLAIQRATHRFTVYVRGTQVRAFWNDQGIDLTITDLRLYQRDGVTPNSTAVGALDVQLKDHFATGQPLFLAFGLTRPFVARYAGDTEPAHWLQVNSIHLSGFSTWALPKWTPPDGS